MSPRTRANAKSAATDVLIPEKLYFRIGEVSRLCHLPAYVLRFWETEFPQLKPVKSSTGQRMYRRKDVESVLRIKQLLYEEGFTIPGARQHLRAEIKTDKKQDPLPFPARPTSELKIYSPGPEGHSHHALSPALMPGPAREATCGSDTLVRLF